jgi:hypothetical protein
MQDNESPPYHKTHGCLNDFHGYDWRLIMDKKAQTTKLKRNARILIAGAGVMIMVVMLAACGGGLPTPTGVPVTGATLPAIPAVTQVLGTLQSVPATALDPCQLLPAEEASTLAGVTFGNGEAQMQVGGMKTCTYSSQNGNVLTMNVIEAQDEAAAKAQLAQFMAQLQAQIPQLTSEGIKVTELPNLADGATIGEASLSTPLGTVSGSIIGVVKGKIFFGFSDIVTGGPAPTSQALQDEAGKILTRLP